MSATIRLGHGRLFRHLVSPRVKRIVFVNLRSCNRWYSSDNTDDNDKSKQAKLKLNALLKSIIKDKGEQRLEAAKHSIDLKLAIKKEKAPKVVEEPPTEPEDDLEKEIKLESLPSDPKFGEKMMAAVKKVAESLEGDPKKIQTELIHKLTSKTDKVDMSELFKGMTISKSSESRGSEIDGKSPLQILEESRGWRVKKIMEYQKERGGRGRSRSRDDLEDREKRQFAEDRRSISASFLKRGSQPRHEERQEDTYHVKLNGGKPLGIFTRAPEDGGHQGQPMDILKTWSTIHAKELKLNVTRPPSNAFEEMILWTERDKFWHFPIDNEQGLEDEANIPFTEHIFLEPKIDSWCPDRGPIRHFMHLVCIGLSKNPYLSAKEKDDYLNWYHEYFLEKRGIIQEIGAGEIK